MMLRGCKTTCYNDLILLKLRNLYNVLERVQGWATRPPVLQECVTPFYKAPQFSIKIIKGVFTSVPKLVSPRYRRWH